MLIIGLTGSIGMGKSATARLFAAQGVPVYDADAAVHALYAGAAVEPVGSRFPGVVRNGIVDRAALAQKVIGLPHAMAQLEAIVHPLVRASELDFVAQAQKAQAPAVVLDIPLLLETGRAGRCDAIVVVTAPAEIQRARVLARPGMTPEKFAAIAEKQMADDLKRRHAHFIVETQHGFPAAEKAVEDILRALAGRPGRGGMPAQP